VSTIAIEKLPLHNLLISKKYNSMGGPYHCGEFPCVRPSALNADRLSRVTRSGDTTTVEADTICSRQRKVAGPPRPPC
jgi:hypothetical protein